MAETNAKEGKPIPKAIADAPELSPDSTEAWQAVMDLHHSRRCGMGLEPIGAPEVLAWCDLNDVPQWRRGWFWRVVRACDAVILGAEASRSAKPSANH